MSNDFQIIIVDEGDEKVRRRNQELLDQYQPRFYGPREREEWFKSRFNTQSDRYCTVIPLRCHAETSFGFLVSYEEGADFVFEIDDDVYPTEEHCLISGHVRNLSQTPAISVASPSRWYNTLENVILNTEEPIFPRGHPYSPDTRNSDFAWQSTETSSVLNMGLWLDHPDLDAVTILYYGGLDGRCKIRSQTLRRPRVIVERGTYFAICSMNTMFRAEIVPAFYQLYMNYLGLDRFDDIWSGLFLKKIADHLGFSLSLGVPLGYHRKTPRNTFTNIKAELEGIETNEILWRIVDKIELDGRTWFDSYQSLILNLEKEAHGINDRSQRDLIQLQVSKMGIWLEIIDKIG